MQLKLIMLFFSFSLFAHAQVSNRDIHDAKGGRWIKDTSYIYGLPYPAGKMHLLAQGVHGSLSHKGELSLDFKMRVGSKICAAREGKVVQVRSDSNLGGIGEKYLNEGNFIIIEHADGSMAYYWHLMQNGVVVSIGQDVQKGQHIGFSGDTGYSAFPHLHFQVVDADGKQVMTRFLTRKKIRYLRPMRWYRAVKS